MSTMIITAAQMIADTAIISDTLVKGLDQSFLLSFNMELINEPTKLMATKKTKFEM